MKKILITVFMVLFFTGHGFAADWHKADRASFYWDAPTSFTDGTPLPAGLTMSYEVYSKRHPNGVPLSHGMVDSEGATITINEGDKVFVGVSAAYTDPDGVQSDFSEIAWSDNAVDCQGGAIFGFHNLKRPDKPKNLRK